MEVCIEYSARNALISIIISIEKRWIKTNECRDRVLLHILEVLETGCPD